MDKMEDKEVLKLTKVLTTLQTTQTNNKKQMEEAKMDPINNKIVQMRKNSSRSPKR